MGATSQVVVSRRSLPVLPAANLLNEGLELTKASKVIEKLLEEAYFQVSKFPCRNCSRTTGGKAKMKCTLFERRA